MWQNKRVKIIFIAFLVVSITFLHYSTKASLLRYHIFYQGLYFLPIILAGFWLGSRGALLTSLSITLLYFPIIIMYWKGFSAWDFNEITEVVLYNVVGVVLGMLRDREQVEEKRSREAERLAAMGKGVSGLAHDLKTPLIAIGGFSRLVQKRLQSNDPLQEKMNLIIEETQRLENMVTEILDFSRPLELHRSQGDIDQILGQSLAIVEVVAREKKVNIQRKTSRNHHPISLDLERMKQVLINLIINAIEASPNGETVSISTYTRRNSLMIEVSDQGCGISPDKREEIFFPFFTTKREGTGLGLPIAKKIIEAHQGYLEVLDNVGKGTTFRTVIPLANKA